MPQQKSDGNRRYTLDEVAVVRGRGDEGTSRKVMENAGERPVHTRNVGAFPRERLKAKKFREVAEKEKQQGYKANGNVNPLPKNIWNK